MQHRAFVRLRFLDLHDHVGACEDFLRRLDDAGAGGQVVIVGQPDLAAGVRLDNDLVPPCDQLLHGRRGQTDPVLMVFDLLRNAD